MSNGRHWSLFLKFVKMTKGVVCLINIALLMLYLLLSSEGVLINFIFQRLIYMSTSEATESVNGGAQEVLCVIIMLKTGFILLSTRRRLIFPARIMVSDYFGNFFFLYTCRELLWILWTYQITSFAQWEYLSFGIYFLFYRFSQC